MNRGFVYGLSLVFSTACGSGTASVPGLSPSIPAGEAAYASVTIQIPHGTYPQQKTPNYVAASTQSVVIVVNAGSPQYFNVTTNSGGCTTTTTTTCTFTFGAPLGSDIIRITAYDMPNGGGNPLSGTTINATLVANSPNVFSAQLGPIVWSSADSGPGTLRQAVLSVDPGGMVTFTSAFTITLISGAISLTKNLTIAGTGASVIIDGNGASQIFAIGSGVTVNLQSLTLQHGNSANGGAVSNAGILNLSHVVFSNNVATQGAAIFSSSGSTLNGSADSFNSNSSTYSGGAIYTAGNMSLTLETFGSNASSLGAGGAVAISSSSGTVTISNTSFSANTAGGGGGAVNGGNGASLSLSNDSFTGNQASSGGAVSNSESMLLDHCTFTNNQARNYGGAVNTGASSASITNSTFTTNGPVAAATSLQGGAIYNGFNLSLAGDTFDRNIAQFGAGVYNNQDITVDTSTFTGNGAASGAGGFYDQGNAARNITINNSTFTGNTSNYYAGGLTVGGGTYSTTITNSTVSGNRASQYGGGIDSFGALILSGSTVSGNTTTAASGAYGAGISLGGGATSTFTNSTISGNTSSGAGGGISVGGRLNLIDATLYGNSALTQGGNIDVASATLLGLQNTIVANGSAPTGPNINNAGSVTSADYNWIQSLTGFAIVTPGAHDHSGPLSNIGPLANNGGPTQTHALLTGSPAIDQIPAASCAAALDQRGVARPQNVLCDIGAFEK